MVDKYYKSIDKNPLLSKTIDNKGKNLRTKRIKSKVNNLSANKSFHAVKNQVKKLIQTHHSINKRSTEVNNNNCKYNSWIFLDKLLNFSIFPGAEAANLKSKYSRMQNNYLYFT